MRAAGLDHFQRGEIFVYILIRVFSARPPKFIYSLWGGTWGPTHTRMGLKWGVRLSDARKLEPFWGLKSHFLDPFWTHFIAGMPFFLTKSAPKWPFFWPFLAPFRPSRAIKMTFLAFFFSWYFGEFHRVLPKSFHFFPIFRFFLVFLATFSVFSLFWGYFRRFASSNL